MKKFRIEAKITEYELRQVAQEAARRGMTKSELIRSLIAKLPDPSPKKHSRD
ncbi:ribbon-helix-helix protein, CopG family [Microseira wollei]|uniref:Ribbon-helix-helix protein CopG domain-containing protein n=1 Tax=Microseira wollei NIES-4236 TaxID=2530354 RepID=A0AAV3XU61_9CYAN|nr:ribbon-helix-helix protein, CopG family [Microseira wollei]GET44590.1 hypothetical protein MiSe_94200 [Microseira wollei NIES-4236]